MASNAVPAAAATAGEEDDRGSRTVTIHILSPSLPAPSRFTLNDLPLETTVGQLRARITQSLPSQPAPSTQRLIYRGRPLTNNSHTLSEILGSFEGTEHSIHMVLPPPSAPIPANDNASISGTGPHMEGSSQLPVSLENASSTLPHAAGDGLRFRGLPTPVTTHERNVQHTWNTMNRAPPGMVPSSPYGMGIPSPADLSHYEDLRRQVENAEHSLDHSFVPSHETLYQLRARTEQLLQRQIHYQGHALYPSVHALLQRIMALYRRIDFLPRGEYPGTPVNPIYSTPQVYLATGPDGIQSLIMPTTSATIFPLSGPTPQPESTRTSPTRNNHIHNEAPAGQHPAVGQDIVRQAVINQQRRQEVENVPAGQYLRRIWLFIRLYFCIYMISSSGTWARVFLVAGAVLIALLSDTEIPRQIQGMLVGPIQRHLEGLARIGGPTDRATQATGGQNTATAQAGGNAGDTIHGELWSSIRRMERALVLLLASLIPGIGERQVAARNAAEAEAERLRQEEQQRLQEQQQQEEAQAGPGPDAAGDDTVENDTTVNSGATEQPQPDPAIAA